MQPTPEQARAVDLFRTGKDLKIEAFAGAGKTSTLRLMTAAVPRRGVYFAFNGSIAAEARRKFPERVLTQTLHSFAYRHVPGAYRKEPGKLTAALTPHRIASLLRLEPLEPGGGIRLTARTVAAEVKAAVKRFCQSDDPRPRRKHVPRRGAAGRLPWWRFRPYASRIAELAARLWEAMADPGSPVPLGHDGYFKLWTLAGPGIPADYILLDEAQDSSEVVVGLLARQPAQVVYVGDRHQQIYEWRGAVNAMDRVKTTHATALTQSFRFGPAIAEAATQVVRVLGERHRIRGTESIRSVLRCDRPQAVLCRTNATVLRRAAEAMEAGRRTAVLGGAGSLLDLLDDVDRLQEGRRPRDPLFFGYRSWRDVAAAAEEGGERELGGLVRLVRRFGVQELRRCLRALAPEEDAELVAATVHRAKGREWPGVALADDFSPFRRRRLARKAVPEDVRLFYVALTRARERVEIPRRLAREFGIGR